MQTYYALRGRHELFKLLAFQLISSKMSQHGEEGPPWHGLKVEVASKKDAKGSRSREVIRKR